jgi:hypothetical protein
LRRINPRTQTPIPAAILIFAVGIILMVALHGNAPLGLIVASTILAIIADMTICRAKGPWRTRSPHVWVGFDCVYRHLACSSCPP